MAKYESWWHDRQGGKDHFHEHRDQQKTCRRVSQSTLGIYAELVSLLNHVQEEGAVRFQLGL